MADQRSSIREPWAMTFGHVSPYGGDVKSLSLAEAFSRFNQSSVTRSRRKRSAIRVIKNKGFKGSSFGTKLIEM